MYTHAVCGGTFDHFHSGHAALLTRAFHLAGRVTIGITTDIYVRQNKYDEERMSGVACPSCSSPPIQSFAKRKQQITVWLRDRGLSDRATLVPIDDVYGPTIQKKAGAQSMDVIIVSSDTHAGACSINEKRKQLGLPVLALQIIPMVPAQDTRPISATRIRKHEIDTEGRLVLPDSMRSELAVPFGAVVRDADVRSVIKKDRDALVIAVGDKTTKRLVQHGLVPSLAIIDMQVERQPYMWEKALWDMLPASKKEFVSGPGYIGTSVVAALAAWSTNPEPTLFVIEGEEDLLVLPVIAQAPHNAVVYYGQPGVGMVRVVVTNEKKKMVRAILTRFLIP